MQANLVFLVYKKTGSCFHGGGQLLEDLHQKSNGTDLHLPESNLHVRTYAVTKIPLSEN